MYRKNLFIFTAFLLATLFLGSCTSPNSKTSLSPTMLPVTATETASLTSLPSSPFTETPSKTLSETPTVTFPFSTPIFLGTSIPAQSEAIGIDNYQRLTNVAQWGRGTILRVSFTPDGSKFAVGSAFGLAVYNTHDLQAAPIWIPFDTPINYNNNKIPFNQEVQNMGLQWTALPTPLSGNEPMGVNSLDGTKQLRIKVVLDENSMYIENSIREIYDIKSGKLLFKLPDETFYVRYNDINQPEGCDLYSTAMCGNVFDPSAFRPYEASFSPSGDTLAILYRAPNYGNTNRFSVLRVYDGKAGKLLDMIGNFAKPIQTFAYEPNGTRLLLAFVDGSIQLWDIRKNEPTSGAWHFNDYLQYAEFTSDGRYLLLNRPDSLEVRSMRDGSLRSRYEAVAYDLSPVDSNIIAISDSKNTIKILELDSGNTIVSIPAHEYQIFTVAFSPDGKYIASSGQDCKVKLWDAKTGKFIHYFEDTRANGYMGGPPATEDPFGNSRIFIYSIAFIKGTNQVVGFGSWGTMVNWNVNSGATNYVVYSAPLEFYNGMKTVSPHYPESFSVDLSNQQFYIGNKIYNLQTGQEVGDYKPPKNLPEGCGPSGPQSMDGNLLFTLGYDNFDGKVCILDAHDNHLIQFITIIPNPDYDLTVAGLSLSKDGKSLIIGTTMGTVNVYQITR